MPEILTGCSYGPISHYIGEIFFIHVSLVGGVEIHFSPSSALTPLQMRAPVVDEIGPPA